jgi:hypothetical protein
MLLKVIIQVLYELGQKVCHFLFGEANYRVSANKRALELAIRCKGNTFYNTMQYIVLKNTTTSYYFY